MKNKWFVRVLFTLAALAALELSGCVTAEAATESTNKGNFGEHIRTPVKDFQSLGLVFTETRFESAKSGSDESQVFTYQALLKEAQALGADAIINVAIDKKIQVTTFPSNRITTWYGSALAIKYTDTLAQTESVTVTADGTTTTTTEKKSVYFNDGGAADTGSRAAQPSAGGQVPVPGAPPAPVPVKGIRQ